MAVLPHGVRGVVGCHWVHMLDRAGPPAMVVVARHSQVVSGSISTVAGQYVEEIENGHVGVRISVQPIVCQPLVQCPRVGGVRRVGGEGGVVCCQRWRCDHDEELVLAGLKIRQDVVVDPFGVGHVVN